MEGRLCVQFVLLDEPVEGHSADTVIDNLHEIAANQPKGDLTVTMTRDNLRSCVPVLDAIQASGLYTATYRFPEVKHPTELQSMIDRMFEEHVDALHVPLSQILLMQSKKSKSHRNHRAELFIWIGAHEGTDFPRHPPLWLNSKNEVEEGSSTFLSIIHNFSSSGLLSSSLTVPCVYRTLAENPPCKEDFERSCLIAAWMGIPSGVKWALEELGSSGQVVLEQYGFSAISKARLMGYSDIVEIIERHNLVE